MFANKFKINLSTLPIGATATTININLNMDYQLVDNSEIIETIFVDSEVEKAINPILDYEKIRFLPIDSNGVHIDKLRYNLNLDGLTSYGSIGFSDDDIKFEKSNFKQTFLNLSFYDTDNPLNQKLLSNITLFSSLRPTDLIQSGSSVLLGKPKQANLIALNFDVENPILNPRGLSEGFYIYDYKDELKVGDTKYLYMRSSFKNAKTGKSLNLMIDNISDTIDNLVHKLYTRYILTRTEDGYYYTIDTTYSNNIVFDTNNITINLYQIKVV